MVNIVRFAPSPTGMLHVGNIRAALLNYLFIRNSGGKFILRIDDTDTERSRNEYITSIKQDLSWLGIDWDETFNQSSRITRYNEAFKKLKDTGLVYPCYETKEDLEIKRKIQLSRGKPPIYDRAALNLSDEDKVKLEQSGLKPHWRFKLFDTAVSWEDMIYGHMEFSPGNTSDPILLKSDGSFVYTFASVVDDLDSEITHIIRGADHIANTAVQLHLYKAIGGDTAKLKFGHYPLLRSIGGEELSKRLSVLSINSWRQEGIEPMAVNSFLAKIGTSDPVEIRCSMAELIEEFSISKISKAEPKFDSQEIYKLNHNLLIKTPYREIEPRLKAEGIDSLSEEFWLMIRDNITMMHEAKTWWNICFSTIEQPSIDDTNVLAEALDLLSKNAPNYRSDWRLWFDDIKNRTKKSGKSLYMPIRLCLTGLEHGPDLKDMLRIIPQDIIESRLQAGIEKKRNEQNSSI